MAALLDDIADMRTVPLFQIGGVEVDVRVPLGRRQTHRDARSPTVGADQNRVCSSYTHAINSFELVTAGHAGWPRVNIPSLALGICR
jgi:hypothetical protein